MCSGWCNNWVTWQHARRNNENKIHNLQSWTKHTKHTTIYTIHTVLNCLIKNYVFQKRCVFLKQKPVHRVYWTSVLANIGCRGEGERDFKISLFNILRRIPLTDYLFYKVRSQNCVKRLLTSSCLSYFMSLWNNSAPTHRFSWNLIFEHF